MPEPIRLTLGEMDRFTNWLDEQIELRKQWKEQATNWPFGGLLANYWELAGGAYTLIAYQLRSGMRSQNKSGNTGENPEVDG